MWGKGEFWNVDAENLKGALRGSRLEEAGGTESP